MHSMTGYGQLKASYRGLQLEMNIKSVNGRHLEIRFHLPKEYIPLEILFREKIEKLFRRGTVDVYVSRKGGLVSKKKKLLVNEPLAQAYFQGVQKLAKRFKLSPAIPVDIFLRIPEMFMAEDSAGVDPAEKKWVLTQFQQSLEKCVSERNREGMALQRELLKLQSAFEHLVESMLKIKSQLNEELLVKYQERLEKKWKTLELDPQRLLQEVAMMIEKSDIEEELTRLKEHLRNCRQILTGPESEGKKLEFYTQELLREINTIGSKSNAFKVTQMVVESKTILEKIREQIQNVE